MPRGAKVAWACAGEQLDLGGFGHLAGLLGFIAFAGDTFPVQGYLLAQIESLRGKSELVMYDVQAASISFHRRFSCQAAWWSAGK
jgi:hypothetical protein